MKKDAKIAAWRKRKNATVYCEHTHFLTSNIAVRRAVTICDGKFDSEWDNVPSDMDGNQTVEPSATQWT